jgi:hypothetical protein
MSEHDSGTTQSSDARIGGDSDVGIFMRMQSKYIYKVIRSLPVPETKQYL